MSETTTAATARYMAAAHGMQSGVAAMMHHDPKPTEPKHLRVGVNSALSNSGALAKLLIAKGVITEEEYIIAVADQMEQERDSYAQLLAERLGTKVTLA